MTPMSEASDSVRYSTHAANFTASVGRLGTSIARGAYRKETSLTDEPPITANLCFRAFLRDQRVAVKGLFFRNHCGGIEHDSLARGVTGNRDRYRWAGVLPRLVCGCHGQFV